MGSSFFDSFLDDRSKFFYFRKCRFLHPIFCNSTFCGDDVMFRPSLKMVNLLQCTAVTAPVKDEGLFCMPEYLIDCFAFPCCGDAAVDFACISL